MKLSIRRYKKSENYYIAHLINSSIRCNYCKFNFKEGVSSTQTFPLITVCVHGK